MCVSNVKNNCKSNTSIIVTFINLLKSCNEVNMDPDLPDFINDSVIANSTFINNIWLVSQPSEIIIKTFSFLPIVLWGIFGNGALIYVIARHRHLRSPTNLLIGNMAVADLLSLLIHPWVFLVYDFFQNYQLGEFGCKTEGAVECALLLTSVMNLTAISYDRLTAIVLPRETRLTRNKAKVVMAVTWIAGAILASPLSYYRTYTERQWYNFVEKYCKEDAVVINIYWHVIITMMVWLPLVIMSVCYIAIFIKLDRYEKQVMRKSTLVTCVKYKTKAAKTMFIVMVTFIVCHMPFTALIFYRHQLIMSHVIKTSHKVQNLVNGTYQILWFVSKIFIFANAGLNPIIYGLMNEKFRRIFKVTPGIQWIFMADVKKVVKIVEDKKKTTRETIVESNRNKIFTIFKTRSPFTSKH